MVICELRLKKAGKTGLGAVFAQIVHKGEVTRRGVLVKSATRRFATIGRPRALTQEQVNLILTWHDAVRALSAQRKALKTLRQIAKELGVPPATVYNVIRRLSRI